jgi:hypothetical protein
MSFRFGRGDNAFVFSRINSWCNLWDNLNSDPYFRSKGRPMDGIYAERNGSLFLRRPKHNNNKELIDRYQRLWIQAANCEKELITATNPATDRVLLTSKWNDSIGWINVDNLF